MRIYTTYKVKIKHYNHIFKDTVKIYRNAVDYLINVCLENWDAISMYMGQNKQTISRIINRQGTNRDHILARQ